jgi:hypothetical protein
VVSVVGGVVVVPGSVAGGGCVVAGESSVAVAGASCVCVGDDRGPVVLCLVGSGVAGASSSPPVRSMLAPKPTNPSRTTAATPAR